jgi:phage-related protein (TIGR01555 family)
MAKPALRVIHNDSFANLMSELGTSGDKSEYATFVYESYDVGMLEEMYAQDAMAGRICELLPETMLREGYNIVLPEQSSKDMAEELKDAMDALDTDEVAQEAIELSRALGGAVILMGLDDGSADPSVPVNPARVRALEWLTVLGRGDIRPFRYYVDPRSPKYGQVELYEVTFKADSSILAPTGVPARDVTTKGEYIHESRLIRVDGFRLPKRLRRDREGWGGSVLERCYRAVRDFNMSWKGASLLLQEFGLMLFQIEGLAQQVNAGNNEIVVNRARQIAIGKSTARAIVADAKEKIERVSTEVGGLPEMLQQLAIRLAAESRYPVTLLMGQAPAGLNATGDSDTRNYYDFAKSAQKRQVTPILYTVAEMLMHARGQHEIPRFWIRYNPLWQLTQQEKADLMAKVATAHTAWVQAQILMPEEIAESTWGGDDFSLDIQLDQKTRKALDLSETTLGQDGLPTEGDPQDPNAVDPNSALNGAQVQAAAEIVEKVAMRLLPRETGVAMLTAFFPLNPAQANKVMGPVGKTFFAEAPPTPPAGQVPTGPAKDEVRLNSKE